MVLIVRVRAVVVVVMYVYEVLIPTRRAPVTVMGVSMMMMWWFEV